MYRYRCAILHDGSTDLNSLGISPQKIQWFYQLAKQLLRWVQALVAESLKSDKTDLAMFWSTFDMGYLYSDKNDHVEADLAQNREAVHLRLGERYVARAAVLTFLLVAISQGARS
jgi:hypothetical protein